VPTADSEVPPAGYPEGYVGPVWRPGKGPITEEKTTLRVVVPQNPSVGDWNKNAFTKWYEERTNVHVEWRVVPGEDAQTKVNAMIAAGDLPDVFMLPGGFSPAQQLLYGSQGLFVPLNDAIDEHTLELKRVFEAYPDTRDIITATDGNIYSMPQVVDCYHCRDPRKLWIYEPWLAELGMGIPETTEEYERVLKAFKERDPNGNGKSDEIPLMTATDAWAGSLDQYFMGSFMYNPGQPWLVLNDGKVGVTFDKPEWREGLRYLNGLYEEGLIPKESFTQTSEQLLRSGNHQGEPILGSVPAGYWGVFLTVDQEQGGRWEDYVAVAPLKGPDGARIAAWDYYGAAQSGSYVVTRACKNPDIAVRWADGMYELEATVRSIHGLKDEDWRWAKQGELGINGAQGLWRQLGTWPPDNGRWWGRMNVQYESNDYRLGEVVDPDRPTFEKPLYEHTREDYYPYRQPQEMQLPPLYMTEDQAAQSGELATTINNYVNQMLAKFMLGQVDANDDAEWNKYLGTLEQMGLPTYLQIHQAAYDAKYGD
jgi:putative aldouronate transport system substrate-binding protein